MERLGIQKSLKRAKGNLLPEGLKCILTYIENRVVAWLGDNYIPDASAELMESWYMPGHRK